MIKGLPTHVYAPGQPFDAVPYDFELKNGDVVRGFGVYDFNIYPQGINPCNQPIKYFTYDGDRITEEIVAFTYVREKDAKVHRSYGYDNRSTLHKELVTETNSINQRYHADDPRPPLDILNFHIAAKMQAIITVLHALTKHPNFDNLMDLSEVMDWIEGPEENKVDVYRTIAEPFRRLIYDLVEKLCDIRDEHEQRMPEEYRTFTHPDRNPKYRKRK